MKKWKENVCFFFFYKWHKLHWPPPPATQTQSDLEGVPSAFSLCSVNMIKWKKCVCVWLAAAIIQCLLVNSMYNFKYHSRQFNIFKLFFYIYILLFLIFIFFQECKSRRLSQEKFVRIQFSFILNWWQIW